MTLTAKIKPFRDNRKAPNSTGAIAAPPRKGKAVPHRARDLLEEGDVKRFLIFFFVGSALGTATVYALVYAIVALTDRAWLRMSLYALNSQGGLREPAWW